MSSETEETAIPQEIQDYFWEYDADGLSWENSRHTITLRLLQVGGLQATLWLRARLSDEEIRTVIMHRRGRGIDPRRLRFWAVLVGLPKGQVDEWIAAARENPWYQRTHS